MTSSTKSKPIQFSGDIAALAVTLRMPVADITGAIDELIESGHLEPIGGGAWRLKPAR
jgi:hypothetical protein